MIKFNNTEAIQALVYNSGIYPESYKSLSGDGTFTEFASKIISKKVGSISTLLTPSGTAALEMAALLTEVGPNDEVIMPSNTFSSTANAFVLRGAMPVFVDCMPDTLNIDVSLIEKALTKKTKCIVPVHYAGVSCDMERIMELASLNELKVVEDAAHGVGSKFKDQPLGTIGHLGAFSFHETKNIICGEGGALLINSDSYSTPAEIIREKGTNRSQFFRGEVDKYTWHEQGSSYLLAEQLAAFLVPQLNQLEQITSERVKAWEYYYQELKNLEQTNKITLPTVPSYCGHNGHLFYVLLDERFEREKVISDLKAKGVSAVSHYVPLHSSPAGKRYGRTGSSMEVTDRISQQLIRLPLYFGIEKTTQDLVLDGIHHCLNR